MLELPEAATIARQLNAKVSGNRIVGVTAAQSPHKFAWFNSEPQSYPAMLMGKTIDATRAFGGMIEIKAADTTILFADGVGLRFLDQNDIRPLKHQLLLDFDDGTALAASVHMYGGLWCFMKDTFENNYYTLAREKPSPLSDDFNLDYFISILSFPEIQKISAKAFLATEQRIPGLGNGVLQDILWMAGIHPKSKLKLLSIEKIEYLFHTVKATLKKMTEQGGRDTEKDLFGMPGGYKTVMSRSGADKPCPSCGGLIKKESYLGGSIYYCINCQIV